MAHALKTAAMAATAVALSVASSGALGDVLDRSTTINGMKVDYKVVVPKNFDPNKTYPAILAFPPGGQDMDLVNATITANYRAEAEKRGYIVIEPAAPNGNLFFEEGARIFPAFLTKILADYKIQDNKFNVAGNSNGGLSAFLTAANYPQYFISVTGFPGFIDNPTPAQTKALSGMCIHMFAGALDSGWPEWMKEQADTFKAAGYHVTFQLEKGQPHVIRTLTGTGAARLFDQFDAARKGICAGN